MSVTVIEYDKNGNPYKKEISIFEYHQRFPPPEIKHTNLKEFLTLSEITEVQDNWAKYAYRLNNLGDYSYKHKILDLIVVMDKFDTMVKAATIGRDHQFLDNVMRWPWKKCSK